MEAFFPVTSCISKVNLLFLYWENSALKTKIAGLARRLRTGVSKSGYCDLDLSVDPTIHVSLRRVRMKKFLFGCFSVALMASLVVAGESRSVRSAFPLSIAPALSGQVGSIPMPAQLSPTPDPIYSTPAQQPMSSPYSVNSPEFAYSEGPVSGFPVEIYKNVKYRSVRNIAPCAVPTIIQVPDPCNKDACCKTCVNVKVCVPPCDPEKVKITRDGNKVRHDYGKYAVTVRSIGHHVVIHYED